MRAPLLAICGLAAAAHSASAWSFQDASVRVNSKGAGIDAGERHTLSTTSPLSTPLSLGAADTLKLLLTVVDDTTPSRAHQAFLTLHDPTTGLSDSFPLSVKESGKAKLELVRSLLLHGNVPHTDPPQTHKDLPHQLLTSPSLRATLLLASFGASPPYSGEVFTITPTHDNPASITPPPATVRYHALPEIKHVFRADPRSPAFIISAVFALAVVAALPVLLGAWLAAGANVGHLGKAVGRAPLSHAAFYGSVAGIEGVFFLYYTSWNLFKTLPVVAVLGVVAVLSGSRALSEVQERRLAGER